MTSSVILADVMSITVVERSESEKKHRHCRGCEILALAYVCTLLEYHMNVITVILILIIVNLSSHA